MSQGGIGGFTARLRNDGNGSTQVVLEVRGELDQDTAPELRVLLDQALDTPRRRVVVDCTELEFCDSTGLNVLLGARLRAQSGGSVIELAALRPPVARMFEITGASTVFTVHDSLDAALANT